jgi:hypothetical protein
VKPNLLPTVQLRRQNRQQPLMAGAQNLSICFALFPGSMSFDCYCCS